MHWDVGHGKLSLTTYITTGEKYLSSISKEQIGSEKMGGHWTESLYLTLSSDRSKRLKMMSYLGFVVSTDQVSVLYLGDS